MSVAEPRSLGFNDSVTVEGRELHVQTEVMGRRETVICTTVLDGGMVRVAEKQVVGAGQLAADDLRAAVRAQHQRHVRQLKEAARGAH